MQEKCIKEFIEQAKAYVNPAKLTPEMLRKIRKVFTRLRQLHSDILHIPTQNKTTPITFFTDAA